MDMQKDIQEIKIKLEELKELIRHLGSEIDVDAEQNIDTFIRKNLSKNTDDKSDSRLDTLHRRFANCERCELSKHRNNIVFGQGAEDARLMFIGEAPGHNEDIAGNPFVGAAGKILDKIIKAMGLSRHEIFITNVVKCRPPNNRDPIAIEIDKCNEVLREEIEIVKPEVICVLGRFSSRLITGSGLPLGQIHGQWFKYKNIDVIPTIHPAACLYNPKNKVVLWEDIKKLMAHLKLRK